jgi:hypothetical protein
MNTLLAIALIGVQTEPASQGAQATPWTGTLAEGLAEMRKLSEAAKPDEALAVADRILTPGGFAKWREEATARPGWKRTLVEAAEPILAAVGLSELAPVERASVHFARGVVLARAEKRGQAGEAFEKARALSGPGELRLDATYDLGWTALEEGETQRKQIPELGGTPPPPAALVPPTPGAPPPPDPLQIARAAYTLARERFVERLKLDARDPDARANVELAQKRLKELAEIQQKRDEEKQKQEQEKKDQEKKDQDQKDEKKDEKNDDAKDPKQDSKSDEQKKKEEEDAQKKDEEQKKEKKDAKPESSKEQLLTKEEIMRLLDTLKDREEEGKKLMERLKRANRSRVKKDW